MAAWTTMLPVASVACVAVGLIVSGSSRICTAVALFIGVFPANVDMVRLWWGKGWPARIAAIGRLPLQVPMITQALKIRRNAPR